MAQLLSEIGTLRGNRLTSARAIKQHFKTKARTLAQTLTTCKISTTSMNCVAGTVLSPFLRLWTGKPREEVHGMYEQFRRWDQMELTSL